MLLLTCPELAYTCTAHNKGKDYEDLFSVLLSTQNIQLCE
jgi:hypothetical protein